jgi:hypothetical protein
VIYYFNFSTFSTLRFEKFIFGSGNASIKNVKNILFTSGDAFAGYGEGKQKAEKLIVFP